MGYLNIQASGLCLIWIAITTSACTNQGSEQERHSAEAVYCDTISVAYCRIGQEWEYLTAQGIAAVADSIEEIYIDGFGGKNFKYSLLNSLINLEEVHIGQQPWVGNGVIACLDRNTLSGAFTALSKLPKLATLEIRGVNVPPTVFQNVKKLKFLTTLTVHTLFVEAGSGFDSGSNLQYLNFDTKCDWRNLHFERLYKVETLKVGLLSDSAEAVLPQITLMKGLKYLKLGIGGRDDTTTKIILPAGFYSMGLEDIDVYAPDLYFDIDLKKLSKIKTLKSLCVRTRTSEENKTYERMAERIFRRRPDVSVTINGCSPWM